jgi:hypothetical protein
MATHQTTTIYGKPAFSFGYSIINGTYKGYFQAQQATKLTHLACCLDLRLQLLQPDQVLLLLPRLGLLDLGQLHLCGLLQLCRVGMTLLLRLYSTSGRTPGNAMRLLYVQQAALASRGRAQDKHRPEPAQNTPIVALPAAPAAAGEPVPVSAAAAA